MKRTFFKRKRNEMGLVHTDGTADRTNSEFIAYREPDEERMDEKGKEYQELVFIGISCSTPGCNAQSIF